MSNPELKITFLLSAFSLAGGIVSTIIGYSLQKVDEIKNSPKKTLIGVGTILLIAGYLLLILVMLNFANVTDLMPDSQSVQNGNYTVNMVCTSPYNCTGYIFNTSSVACPEKSCPQQIECPVVNICSQNSFILSSDMESLKKLMTGHN